MIPKRIIEKAKEGGWKPQAAMNMLYAAGDYSIFKDPTTDPLFWKALFPNLSFGMIETDEDGRPIGWMEADAAGTVDEWEARALRFAYLILTGGDTEKFWDEIMPEKHD